MLNILFILGPMYIRYKNFFNCQNFCYTGKKKDSVVADDFCTKWNDSNSFQVLSELQSRRNFSVLFYRYCHRSGINVRDANIYPYTYASYLSLSYVGKSM